MADKRLTKIKVKTTGGSSQVLVLVNHPMETGTRKDKNTGKLVPAHYIQKMTFSQNGKTVAEANLSQGVSRNPLIGIELNGAKAGDKVSVKWSDNQGESGSADATV